MIHLTSSRLQVDLTAPGENYRGTRFDWTGFVTQVTLDGEVRFCVPEAEDGTGTGGVGLCNEFGIFKPVGYDDAAPGDWFPKIGVGLLRRPDAGPYRFSHAYECQPFTIRGGATAAGSATFAIDPLACRGYAVRLSKSLTVADNRLRLDYRLDNVGERAIETNEYCHNFCAINAAGIGPEYELQCSFRLAAAEWPREMAVAADSLTWRETPHAAFYAPLRDVPPAGAWWRLRHRPSGWWLGETVAGALDGVTVWGTHRVVSVEMFVPVRLQPGASATWRREYEFSRDVPPAGA